VHHGQSGNNNINILVTGHKGYIGYVLIPALIESGYKNIIGLDTDLYRQSLYYGQDYSGPELNKDLRDITPDDLNGIDTIIHLAGLSNDPLGNLNSTLTYEINYLATLRLAELAKTSGVKRFIFSSSCSVYGASSGQQLSETSETEPVTDYAKSKLLSEQGLSELADADFCPVFLRNATAYGLSPKMRFDLVVNNLSAWAYTTGNIFLKSDGTAWRPLVHIKDICRAFISTISAPEEKVFNQIFNVGSNLDNYRIIDIACKIQQKMAGTVIKFADNAEKDTRNYNVSFDKLEREFPELENTVSLDEGIDEIYRSFREYGLDAGEFESARYNRLECIKLLQKEKTLNESLRWN